MITRVYEDEWKQVPPEPPTLKVAVKDYLVWLKDPSKNIYGPQFETIKQRIVMRAVDLVAKSERQEVTIESL